MADIPDDYQNSLKEIRQARDQAEMLRNQLLNELQRVAEEDQKLSHDQRDNPNRLLGREAMRKAIAAADCAIASIDQALREMQQLNDNLDNFPPAP